MIVYKSTKAGFVKDVMTNDIAGIILNAYKSATGGSVAEAEVQSWNNSLQYVDRVVNTSEIPDDAGVCVEFHIPLTNKRVDFIIAGQGQDGKENVVLIELKQWSSANATNMPGIVSTRFRGGEQDVSHPSYQAWSYAALLSSFNSTIYTEDINLVPCAYCHNYETDDQLTDKLYIEDIEKAPLFLKPDALKLQEFIKEHVRFGDKNDVIYRIENGLIKPSKSLADSVTSMLQGNQEFVLIDDQKIAKEKIISICKNGTDDQKTIVIVEGGPGTGKSVVAINLLVELTQMEKNVRYVSKNAAPRAVYESKLTGSFRKSEISNFFSGSGSFMDTPSGTFDVLIVDEAHRLNEKSGLYQNLGENQIKEIINASKIAIFFLDEDQKVTFSDIGSQDEINKWASQVKANTENLTLESQFRCNGSDGYLAWLDNTLEIRMTANRHLSKDEFDFRVLDSPIELRSMILEKNEERNSARMVAGYCWDWVSKKNPHQPDICFPEYDFAHFWNLDKDGSLWIIAPESVHEIGCIHTCQGLEVDYIGVIIGPDVLYQNGKVVTDGFAHPGRDRAIRGFRGMAKKNPEEAYEKVDSVIKNTYRTLMTRGMKGCFVYCVDDKLADYLRSRMDVEYE